MAESPSDEISQVTYEQLAGIEDEFEEIDTQIIKQQYTLSLPAYARRAAVIAQIPSFWPIVLETCPPEIDQFITPQDSQIFADSLTSISVSRPEIDSNPAGQGNPRTVAIRFDFAENEFFDNAVLEKTFHWRRASDGWTGLVSEPVDVAWKKGKDLSEGLTGLAVRLFEARRKAGNGGDGDWMKTDLPEFDALAEKLSTGSNAINTSFFTWFGFVSGRRYVSAAESEKAEKEYREKKAKGEAVAASDEDEDEDDDDDDEEEADKNDDSVVEVHEDGEQLAISIAEDLWPGAIKYFTQAQGMDGEMSDLDFEEMEMEGLEGEDSEEGEGEAVDIRALIGGGNKRGNKSERKSSGSGAPAAKKQKK